MFVCIINFPFKRVVAIMGKLEKKKIIFQRIFERKNDLFVS